MTCPVCCTKYTSSVRKPVGCSHCGYEACAQCIKNYVLSTPADPACMSCRVPWTREVLDASLTAAFVNGPYKAHRENVLVEREIALLPASQHLVANFRTAESLKSTIRETSALVRDLQGTLDSARREMYLARRRLERIETSGFQNDGAAFRDDEQGGEDGNSERGTTFIRACPAAECRGFLSSAWKCGTCGIFACPACHEAIGDAKDAPHECDENDLATARLLRRDTKPCPSCASMIHKIEGCDQMFCVQCHTAFSWRTGQAVRAGTVIHNPHYYEFIRRRDGEVPRAPGDMPCGGLPGSWEIERTLRRLKACEDDHTFVLNFHRVARHVENVEMPRLANAFDANDNTDLRLQYLINRIDRDVLKTKLVQREKKRDKELAKRHIYEMMCATVGDMCRQLMNGNPGEGAELVETVVDELRALRTYTNSCLKDVQKRFSCSVYFV